MQNGHRPFRPLVVINKCNKDYNYNKIFFKSEWWSKYISIKLNLLLEGIYLNNDSVNCSDGLPILIISSHSINAFLAFSELNIF